MYKQSRKQYRRAYCRCCATMSVVAVGLKTCDACIDYAAKYGRNHRAKGMCMSCAQPAADGKSRCERHLKLPRAYTQTHKQDCINQGLCIECRTPIAPGERGHRCEYHKYKHRMAERKRKAKRRAERKANTRRTD